MYFFVNYQLTKIQAGAQSIHAVVEYGLKYFNTVQYQQYAKEDKTVIILNGGTTNNNPERLGTLNKLLLKVKELQEEIEKHKNKEYLHLLNHAEFSEPDLGDQLTSFCLLLDERVWDKINYPFYNSKYSFKNYLKTLSTDNIEANLLHELKELIKGLPLA